MEIRAATSSDADAAVELLSEAARRSQEHGFDMWPDPFPREHVLATIERGELYLAFENGEPAGTLTLQWADPHFWGDRPPDAGYVHRMAVRPRFRGLGPELLAWAAERIAEHGRSFLRLDCIAANEGLRRYYEGLGFEQRGERVFDDGLAVALYERPVR